MIIDKYAYCSKLKNIDSMQKLIFALTTLAICIWADSVVISSLVIIIMGGMTVFKGGTPFKIFIKLMIIPIAFLSISVLTILINVSKNPEGFSAAVSVGDVWVGFLYSGTQDALNLFCKSLGAVSCLYFLSLSTPIVDFLSALRRLRFPKLLVEIMGLVYRFIFVLLETADTIYNAQNCRLGYSNISRGYQSLGSLVSVLFLRAYKRSDELYTALEARGYEGEIKVLEETVESNRTWYASSLGINVILVLLNITLKLG